MWEWDSSPVLQWRVNDHKICWLTCLNWSSQCSKKKFGPIKFLGDICHHEQANNTFVKCKRNGEKRKRKKNKEIRGGGEKNSGSWRGRARRGGRGRRGRHNYWYQARIITVALRFLKKKRLCYMLACQQGPRIQSNLPACGFYQENI